MEGFAGINRIRKDTFRSRKVSDVIIGFFVGFFVAWAHIFRVNHKRQLVDSLLRASRFQNAVGQLNDLLAISRRILFADLDANQLSAVIVQHRRPGSQSCQCAAAACCCDQVVAG